MEHACLLQRSWRGKRNPDAVLLLVSSSMGSTDPAGIEQAVEQCSQRHDRTWLRRPSSGKSPMRVLALQQQRSLSFGGLRFSPPKVVGKPDLRDAATDAEAAWTVEHQPRRNSPTRSGSTG